MPQVVRYLVEIEPGQQVVDSLGTHLGDKLVRVAVVEVLVVGRKAFNDVEIFFLRQEVHITNAVSLFNAGLYDHITLVIDDGIEFFGLQPQQGTDLVGQ